MASHKGELEAGHVKEALAGKRPLHKLFSKRQRYFWAEHAPAGLDGSRILELSTKCKPADPSTSPRRRERT